MFFTEMPEHILERQELVRSLFMGETLERPLAYLCPLWYSRKMSDGPFDEVRALEDTGYLADYQEHIITGIISEDNDNVPYAWARAGGVHFIDSLFGIMPEVKHSGFWCNPLDWDLESGELPDYDAMGGMVPRALDEISTLRKRFGVLQITPPDLSGPLNGALNVFENQRFLRFTKRDPDAARRAIEHVAQAILDVNRILCDAIGPDVVHTDRKSWLPPEYVMLPWCAEQLVSEQTYNDVVRPADEMILNEFDGGVLHICGRTTHLISTLREMKSVRGVELQGSPGTYDTTCDYRAYFDGLRDDQVIIVMVGSGSNSGITPQEVVEISGGDRTIMRFMELDELQSFR